MSRRQHKTNLPAPFLKKIMIKRDKTKKRDGYPFNLPWLNENFELSFRVPITIIVGENGTGKSTLLEGIAAVAGYDEAGGGKGYRPVDHSNAADKSGALLADVFSAHWLPRVTNGWFFRAESFFSVARYLDEAAKSVRDAPPDFLSWSHGEGFIRFFEERCTRQGIYFFDEPESALSPMRQIELMKMLNEIGRQKVSQVIMATHSPLLMSLPDAQLLEVTRFGFEETHFTDTKHFKLYCDFVADPENFIQDSLKD